MRARAVAGALLAVIVGGATFLLWPTESSRVRARVVAAADAVSARPGEGDFDRLARLAGLAKMLARDIVIEAEPGGPAIHGREAVAALATQLSTAGGALRVELSDIEVTLDEGSPHAVAIAVARVTSTAPGAASTSDAVSRFDGEAVRIELARTDDGWLITRASAMLALAR